ncbi:(2Fe-2S)-binding protein [Streptomyces sp. CC219B]|uniref:(2Fe-2S)-binding protein n=1 Tax=Streptomyces sp. CC219B TaxID=3044574 RepID=UPI0024A7B353|nr:(2Fe-2S)-binding protein [Streptomyces sp. CC219B]
MVLLHVVDLDPDLAALRPLGPFFVLRTSGAPRPPLPTLAQAYGDISSDVYGNSVTFRIRKVADALRTPESRVAASVAQQGLAARLWSVALGCAALYGTVPDLAPRLLRWDADGSAPDDLWLTEVRPADGDLADTVLHAHLVPLTALVHTRYRVAEGLLWGNAASALAGAARQLERWALAHGRTETAVRTRTLTAGLLAHPLLAGTLTGTGRLTRTGTLTGTAFRRRSCCLYYRVPGGGVCGDCCFTRPPRSSPRASSG